MLNVETIRKGCEKQYEAAFIHSNLNTHTHTQQERKNAVKQGISRP